MTESIEVFQGREVLDVGRMSRSLERQLTDQQVNDLGRQLATLHGKIEAVDAERADAARAYATELKELRGIYAGIRQGDVSWAAVADERRKTREDAELADDDTPDRKAAIRNKAKKASKKKGQ